MNKNDLRYRTTEKLICDAYIKLSNEKNGNKITVTELVKEANINRGTFYLHYQDVNEVCKDIADKFLKECLRIINHDGDISLNKEAILNTLKYIKENKNYVNFIIQDNFKSFISKGIVDYIKNEIIKKYKLVLDFDEEKMKPIVTYMVFGSVALIVDWAKNDYEDQIETIAESLSVSNETIIKNFFLK